SGWPGNFVKCRASHSAIFSAVMAEKELARSRRAMFAYFRTHQISNISVFPQPPGWSKRLYEFFGLALKAFLPAGNSLSFPLPEFCEAIDVPGLIPSVPPTAVSARYDLFGNHLG
ncbi:MAG: hypothetical protein ACR2PT_00565, partial [Endozoicomonas sp.]